MTPCNEDNNSDFVAFYDMYYDSFMWFHHSDPNDDVMILDHDRSVPIVTRSVTRSEHQLYEDKQEVDILTNKIISGNYTKSSWAY